MSKYNKTERRQFSRVVYHNKANFSQGECKWCSTIKDISIHGALLEKPKNWKKTSDNNCYMEIALAENTPKIKLQASLVAEQENNLRFQIEKIDIESMTQLRRLVELNIGNDTILHENLNELINSKK